MDGANFTIQKGLIAQDYGKAPTFANSDEAAKIKEKTDQFEAIILKMLLDESNKNEKNIFTDNDPGDDIYKSMYNDELSKSSAGGFGFSQMLFDHLVERNNK